MRTVLFAAYLPHITSAPWPMLNLSFDPGLSSWLLSRALITRRREAENMGGCGMEGLMYKKVKPCNFLCHPYAADLIMLTVEVLAHDLEVRTAGLGTVQDVGLSISEYSA